MALTHFNFFSDVQNISRSPKVIRTLNCGARPLCILPACEFVRLYVCAESHASIFSLLLVISAIRVMVIFIAADAAYLIVYILYRTFMYDLHFITHTLK